MSETPSPMVEVLSWAKPSMGEVCVLYMRILEAQKGWVAGWTLPSNGNQTGFLSLVLGRWWHLHSHPMPSLDRRPERGQDLPTVTR
jgi:hypothetical protein